MTTAKQFFEDKFSRKVTENPACMQESGVKAKSVSIEIDGTQGGAWTFDFDGQGCVKMRAGLEPEAACTISTSDKTFEGMMTGSVNVPMAFVMRKIKVKGETSLAAKLGLALQKVYSKQ